MIDLQQLVKLLIFECSPFGIIYVAHKMQNNNATTVKFGINFYSPMHAFRIDRLRYVDFQCVAEKH